MALPARGPRPGEAHEPAGRGSQRTAAELRESPLWAVRRGGCTRPCSRRGIPTTASIIGSHADIEAARLEDVREFFREYYAPNNASMAIVGDIDKARVKALVEKYFGPIPAGKPVEKPKVATPAITAERRATVTDKVELPRVSMSWIVPPALPAGRRRGGSACQYPGRRQIQPAVQEAGL